MNEYKGIYYNNDDKEQKYYEGGAHFKYKDLYIILENIFYYREKLNRNDSKSSNKINIPKNLNLKRVSLFILIFIKNSHIQEQEIIKIV